MNSHLTLAFFESWVRPSIFLVVVSSLSVFSWLESRWSQPRCVGGRYLLTVFWTFRVATTLPALMFSAIWWSLLWNPDASALVISISTVFAVGIDVIALECNMRRVYYSTDEIRLYSITSLYRRNRVGLGDIREISVAPGKLTLVTEDARISIGPYYRGWRHCLEFLKRQKALDECPLLVREDPDGH